MTVERPSGGRGRGGNLGSLAWQTVVYGLGSVAGSAVPLVLVPLYTRVLSQAGYGALEMLVISVSVLSVLLQMGMGPAVFRSLKPDAPPGSRDRAMTGALGVVAAMGVGAVVVVTAVREPLTRALLGEGFPTFLVVAATVQAATHGLASIPLALLRMEERARLHSVLNAGRAVLAIGILVPLTLTLGLVGVVLGLAAESAIFAGIALAVVRSRWSWRWSGAEVRALLRFGLPLIGTGFGLMIVGTADRYLLRSFATLEAVGVYALGYRIASTLNMLVRSFQTSWPAVLFAQDHGAEAVTFFARVAKYVVVTLAFVGMALSVFAGDILGIVAPDSWVPQTEPLVPVLCFSFVMRGVFTATAVGVNLRDRTEGTTVAANVAAAVQVLVGLLLVPAWGTLGAAWATAVAMTTLAAVGTAISLRLMWIPYEWGRLTLVLLAGAGWVVAGGAIDAALGPGLASVAARGALVLSFPLLLLATRTVDLRDFPALRGRVRP